MGVLNEDILFNITVPTTRAHGFAGLGTSSFGIADFDNVQIMDSKMTEKYHQRQYKIEEEIDFVVEMSVN